MSAALKRPTANDNLPAVPIPAQPVPAPAQTLHPRVSDPSRDGIMALLLVWTLALGAIVGLAPDMLPWPAVAAGLGTAVLAMVGTGRDSQPALALGALAWAATAMLAALLSRTPGAALAWPLLLGGIWIVLAGSSVRLTADGPAGLLGLAFGAVGGFVAALFASLPIALALVAVGAFLYLGLARAMVKHDMMTAGAHYLAAWLLACASAGGLLYLGGVGVMGVELSLALASVGTAAVVVWGMQGVFPLLQALSAAAIASLFAAPGLEARLIDSTQFAFPQQPLALMLGLAALFAAGIAMTARGIRAGRLGWACLGTAVALAAVFIAGQPLLMTVENAVILGLSAIVTTTGLVAARVR